MKKFLVITSSVLLLACNGSSNYESAACDSVAVGEISSSAAVENFTDSTRKFIRTADLRFRVKNVIHSTNAIEAIAIKSKGFVTLSELNNSIDLRNTQPISNDSLLETTAFTSNCSIAIRIPNYALDTVLKQIALQVDFLDQRVIKANDVALSILSNQLTEKRSKHFDARVLKAVDKNGNKLKDIANTETLIAEQHSERDRAYIDNRSLMDQVNYSTITMSIYQRPTIKHDVIFNDATLTNYQPSFGYKIAQAFITGYEVLVSIIEFIISSWAVILIGVAVFVGYKYIKKK